MSSTGTSVSVMPLPWRCRRQQPCRCLGELLPAVCFLVLLFSPSSQTSRAMWKEIVKFQGSLTASETPTCAIQTERRERERDHKGRGENTPIAKTAQMEIVRQAEGRVTADKIPQCSVQPLGSVVVRFNAFLSTTTVTVTVAKIPEAPVSGRADNNRAERQPGQVSRSISHNRDGRGPSNPYSNIGPGAQEHSKAFGDYKEAGPASVDTANVTSPETSSNTSVSVGQSVNSTHSRGPGDDGQLSVDSILCEYYSPWSKWRPCNRKCEQSRMRRCQRPEHCGQTWLKENRTCQRKRGACSTFSYRTVGFRRRNRLIERVLYDVLYTDWSDWGPCTRSCRQRRRRKCTVRDVCHNSFIQETRRCTAPGSRCQRRYSLRPSSTIDDEDYGASPERDVTNTTSSAAKPQSGHSAAQATKKKKKAKDTKDGPGSKESPAKSFHDLQDTCGQRPPGTRGSYRVVGGQEAQRLSWPWQAAILTRWEEQYCAGTLVAPQWVLTAAHCVRKKNRKRRLVMFEGSEDDIRPDKDFPHPEFDYHTITNDIALVHLRHPVKDRSQVRYACLPDRDDFTPDRGALCYILGWGKTRNTHLFGAETLHEAQVPLVNRKRCQKVFDYHINKTQVCAGYRKGGIDSCAGDSGGPLLCPKTTGGVTRWHLTGITSYGEGCGRRGKYGIYTKVASYLDWIKDTIDSF
ncbi:hypothetical protein BaRGS_00001166 [Batillaria attramentaria]|uniref:Peptidase S1 domain-containing protein n=1 Tax=Batillaria attramentaria TaxID=370345 RepID=A0ABD0M714_9CAEN